MTGALRLDRVIAGPPTDGSPRAISAGNGSVFRRSVELHEIFMHTVLCMPDQRSAVSDDPGSGDNADAALRGLPGDLVSALERLPDNRKAFEALSPQEKQDLIRWIESARDSEHRKQRIDMTIRSLR